MLQKRPAALVLVLGLAASIAAAAPVVAAPVAADAPSAPASPLRAALNSRLQQIESTIDAKRKEFGIPGAALVIVRGNTVLCLRGMGLRDIDKKLPVTPDTRFAIGSSTKAFTAMTVLMSQEDGKLALTDSPGKYLPYFRLRDPEADTKITVRDLLTHTSGLGRTDLAWVMGKLSREELIRVAGQAKPTAPFGATFQYQNVMYAAAGEVVARAQRQPWETVVAQRILRPLGMTATTLTIADMQRARDFARGYTYDTETKTVRRLPMRDLRAIAPAGAINSSARDMAQWVRLMLAGGVWRGRRLVSAEGMDALTGKQVPIGGGSVGYGLGWFVRDWNGHKVVEHGGNIDGFNAQVALMPDQKLGFVLLTNVLASPLGTFAMETIWENLVGKPVQAAKAAVPEPAPAAAADPLQEVASYRLEAAGLQIDVAHKDGKLLLTVPGQPVYTLENVGGRRYKLANAPAGFFATFRPDKKNRTELFLEQPQGDIVLSRWEPVAAASGESLPNAETILARMIAAAGGEAALRKHRTLTVTGRIAWVNQGITGDMTLYARAPNARATRITLRALGKKIGTLREIFDGTRGVEESSFAPFEEKTGKALAAARIDADFYGLLNDRARYKSVSVVRRDTLNGEAVFVLVKTPAAADGDPVTEYVSTTTSRLLRRDTLQPLGPTVVPVEERYEDYRGIDGVLLAFRTVTRSPLLGETLATITDARFNVPINDAVFQRSRNK